MRSTGWFLGLTRQKYGESRWWCGVQQTWQTYIARHGFTLGSPTGLCPPAQGWPDTAYPGEYVRKMIYPDGVTPAGFLQPLGLTPILA
jgi:hypothetical protein